MQTKHDPYLAFRYHDFRLLFIATTLSVVGGILESTALGWELYERTRAPLVLGNIGLAEFLPVLLLALPADHIADRFDRKRVAVITRLFEIVGALGLVGAFDNVSMVIRSVLVPLRTPDAMRGRVNAVERLFISSSNELGAWESGVTAAAFGPIASVVGGGIGTLLVVGLVAACFPQLRTLTELKVVE